jgi:hypothetical protein
MLLGAGAGADGRGGQRSMIFFHSSPRPESAGKVVRPGNWGRIVRKKGKTHPYWEAEPVFERIRQERFNHLPSRLNSAYGCPTQAQLEFFVRVGFRNDARAHYLYAVEKLEPDAPQHVADYSLMTINAPGETLEGQAERYWQGGFRYKIADNPGMICEEIITLSPLVILEQIGFIGPKQKGRQR